MGVRKGPRPQDLAAPSRRFAYHDELEALATELRERMTELEIASGAATRGVPEDDKPARGRGCPAKAKAKAEAEGGAAKVDAASEAQ